MEQAQIFFKKMLSCGHWILVTVKYLKIKNKNKNKNGDTFRTKLNI